MARGAIPIPRERQSQTRTRASTTTRAAISRGRVPLSTPLTIQSITGSGGFRDAEQMGEIFEEHADVGHRALPNELLVHVRLPGETLHVGVSTHFDETLAPLIVDVPETLQQPEDPEHPPMSAHEVSPRLP